VTTGTSSVLFSKLDTEKEHSLTIELFDKAGKTRLRQLFKGTVAGHPDGHKGFHMLKWDGTDPEGKETFKGKYTVRWTTDDGYSDYWVEIK
jgi:hypothetical protein